MTRPTTITLSFLLVLLVIAGMTIKSQMENVPMPHHEPATDTGIIRVHNNYLIILDSTKKLPDGMTITYVQDTIPNYFPNHSEIPTR